MSLTPKQIMLNELGGYSLNRKLEYKNCSCYSFFRNLVILDGPTKTNAADKLYDYCLSKTVEFTPLDLKALLEKNSTLGGLVRNYIKQNYPLPKEIIDAHNAMIEKDKEVFMCFSWQKI